MADLDVAALTIVGERLEDLRKEVAGLRGQLTAQAVTLVPRGEWVQRNESVDERFRTQGREIGDLRAEVRARRVPWTSVAGTVTAIVALGLSLMTSLAQ